MSIQSRIFCPSCLTSLKSAPEVLIQAFLLVFFCFLGQVKSIDHGYHFTVNKFPLWWLKSSFRYWRLASIGNLQFGPHLNLWGQYEDIDSVVEFPSSRDLVVLWQETRGGAFSIFYMFFIFLFCDFSLLICCLNSRFFLLG